MGAAGDRAALIESLVNERFQHLPSKNLPVDGPTADLMAKQRWDELHKQTRASMIVNGEVVA